jgi:hypothetical protein
MEFGLEVLVLHWVGGWLFKIITFRLGILYSYLLISWWNKIIGWRR